MISDESQFIILEAKNEGMVTFEDNDKGKIIDIGNIGITLSTCIENILLVDGLKHNLLSISQLCDRGYKVVFESSMYIVTSPFDNSIRFIGHRHSNIYMVDLDNLSLQNIQCLVAMNAKINKTSWQIGRAHV